MVKRSSSAQAPASSATTGAAASLPSCASNELSPNTDAASLASSASARRGRFRAAAAMLPITAAQLRVCSCSRCELRWQRRWARQKRGHLVGSITQWESVPACCMLGCDLGRQRPVQTPARSNTLLTSHRHITLVKFLFKAASTRSGQLGGCALPPPHCTQALCSVQGVAAPLEADPPSTHLPWRHEARCTRCCISSMQRLPKS